MVLVLIACSLILCLRAVVIWQGQESGLVLRQESGRRGEQVLRDVLDRLGHVRRADGLQVGDLRRGAEIDVVLPGKGFLLVLEAKNWSGVVHGDRGDEEWWVEAAGGARWRRRNPINQASRQARLLARETGVPTASCCVMLHSARPPAGSHFPAGVISISQLPAVLGAMLERHPKGRKADDALFEEACRTMLEKAGSKEGRRSADAHRSRMMALFKPMPWVPYLAMGVVCSCLAGFLEDGILSELPLLVLWLIGAG